MWGGTDEAQSTSTIRSALDHGINVIDTAPVYGFGVSETRLGLAIKSLPRADIVISSKIGYDLVPIPPEELKPALWDQPGSFRAEFDYFLLAGRYTLLEQEPLATLLPLCEQRGTRIIIGGPYNSGILATGAVKGATFNTRPAPEPVLERVRRIEAVCLSHKVSLPAAALQFPLGHPLVSSVIPGARSAEELKQNLAYLREDIPPALWADLKREGLVEAGAPSP